MMQIQTLPIPPCIVPETDLLPDNWLGLITLIGLALSVWWVVWFVRRQRWACDHCGTRFRVYPSDQVAPIRAHWDCPACGGWVER